MLSYQNWLGNLLQMRTPDQYREFASECYRFAAEAKTEMHQKMMEEIARALSEVAEEVETEIAQQR
jgi:BMFP domain-containing protein YqiC